MHLTSAINDLSLGTSITSLTLYLLMHHEVGEAHIVVETDLVGILALTPTLSGQLSKPRRFAVQVSYVNLEKVVNLVHTVRRANPFKRGGVCGYLIL